jgi:hypothetical protein
LPILQKENGQIIIPKPVLKSGRWRRSESGCGIFNLKLLYFHYTLISRFADVYGSCRAQNRI